MPNVNGSSALTQLHQRFDLQGYGHNGSGTEQGLIGSCWTFAAIACVENNVAGPGAMR